MQEKKKGMPLWAKLVLGVLALSIVVNLFNSKPDQPSVSEAPVSKDTVAFTEVSSIITPREKALAEIRKERKIFEAIITDADVLYASVKDDGTRRDGYAEYLCQILKRNNVTDVKLVKVVKVNSMKDPNRDNSYGVLLGQSFCR